jgi:hypothetical protein
MAIPSTPKAIAIAVSEDTRECVSKMLVSDRQ